MLDLYLRQIEHLFIPRIKTVRNCPHAGQAVPRALRQRGITSNSCNTKIYVLRLLEVLTVLSVIPILEVIALIAPPRARGRRPRRAVEERSAKNEICLMRDARFVVSTNRASIHPRIKTVRNCPHAGRAVPRAPRQSGITSNSCNTNVDVLRLLKVPAIALRVIPHQTS